MVFTGIVEAPWELAKTSNLIHAECINPSCIIFNDPDTYTTLVNNKHHWTTHYVWNKCIPQIMETFNLPFVESNFVLYNNYYNDCDLSYHNFINDIPIEYINNTTNEYETILMSKLRIPTISNKSSTAYHNLFKGYHSVCQINNSHSITDRYLIINCDSMAIPIIPIMIPFYSRILILDNRTPKSFHYLLNEYVRSKNPIDVIELFHAWNWNKEKNIYNIH